MGNGWTPERRARQAELIRTWRPWEQSTGPRTAKGKAQAARNGQEAHGWTSGLLEERENLRTLKRAVGDLLARQRELLAQTVA